MGASIGSQIAVLRSSSAYLSERIKSEAMYPKFTPDLAIRILLVKAGLLALFSQPQLAYLKIATTTTTMST